MNPQFKPAPVYIVRGDDQSLVDGQAHRLVVSTTGSNEPNGDQANPPSDLTENALLSVEDYRAGQSELSAVVDSCRTLPFLTDRRVVIVRDAGQLTAEDAQLFSEYLQDPLDTTVLIFIAGSGRIPAALEKSVKAAKGEIIDTSVPSGTKGRTEWLAARMAESSLKIDAGGRERLAEHLGQDIERVEGLIASLEAAYGPKAKIGEEELEPFLGSGGDIPPWELTGAIDSGATGKALLLLGRMVSAGGRNALAVLAILQRHYSQMLSLDGSGATTDAQAAEILNLKQPFIAKRIRTQALKLGAEKIGRAITLLADADLDLKGRSGWPPELVMEVLVARLSRMVPTRR
ncbi:MAG TPA: DNA polymerase III subunit delta [Acidimicrobiales bacterium]|nr:DNA polymerase III subunit delta [Acidimicrobiales bacterium]